VGYTYTRPSGPERVWRRGHTGGEERYSERAYAGGNALFALLAATLTLIGQQYTLNLGIDPDKAGVLAIVLIVVALISAFVMMFSGKPPVSLTALIVMSGSLGLFLGIVDPGIAVGPLLASLAVAVVLALVGWFVRADLHKWGSWLLGLTTALIVAGFLLPFIESFGVNPGTYEPPLALSIFSALLFSGWMIYDWNRARRMPRTLDNMIDNGGAIYLDWLNIYLAFRRVTGS